MLQRAATNAYSWWWASHIRTKQSKWLEQSLQDMEEKVQHVLKLIEEDGDSFAKRAEMYYKKRPELINFVEDSYRNFRALAERYDQLSTELQNANNTIASVFPEGVQYAMDDEDDSGPTIGPKSFSHISAPNAPKVPKAPIKDFKGLVTKATKKLQEGKLSKAAKKNNNMVAKTGLSKTEALEEIDKLQKKILALQTAKEFVMSSYESKLAKYWGIENQIMEMQQRVSSLEDEFGVGKVIDDDEARTLMAEAALKSCEDTLSQLQEEQETSSQEAKEEYKRIESARERLKSLKHELLPHQADIEKPDDGYDTANARGESRNHNKEVDEAAPTTVVQENIKEQFEAASHGSLTVTQLAEKIDELVNKVIGLETEVWSQTALINNLRTENYDLHAQIQSLEDNKASLIDGTQNVSIRLKEIEDKLHVIQDLNEDVGNQNDHLQANFTEAHCSLGHLSEKLHSVKPDEEAEVSGSMQEERESIGEIKSEEKLEKQGDVPSPGDISKDSNTLKTEEGEDKSKPDLSASVKNQTGEDNGADNDSENPQDSTLEERVEKQDQPADSHPDAEPLNAEIEKEDGLNWQQMLLSGLEDREKILLTEYTTILRNFKDAKRKLSDAEKKNRDSHFETTVQLREMRSAIAKRDAEIQSLRQRLNIVQASTGEDENLMGDQKASTSDLIDDNRAKPESRTDYLSITEDIHLTKEEEEHIKLILIEQAQTISLAEEKLRMNIDAILDENLDFWLRFSTAFHKVQKFKTGVQDLQDETMQLKKKQEGGVKTDIKSDVRPIFKHLREIETELTLWLEQSGLLKEELERRFSSLCNIQEEITKALKEGMEEEEIKFTSHQAAKFQGEVLNMKQENNKVREELQAGYDHVTALQFEIEKTLAKLDQEFGLSGAKNPNQPQLGQSTSRSRIPLRSFIFGHKPKKQKHSIFSHMHPSRKFQVLRAGVLM